MPQRVAAAEVVAGPIAPATTMPRASTSRSIMWRALLGFTALIVVALGSAWLLDASIEQGDGTVGASADGRGRLAAVRHWSSQPHHLDIARVASSGVDLVVVDETLDGQQRSDARAKALQQLKRKPDGSKRLVMAYLSVGEAEASRPYWHASWVSPARKASGGPLLGGVAAVGAPSARAHVRVASVHADTLPLSPSPEAPAWLGAENVDWRGNFNVRYWHPDWKNLVLGQPEATLDRIIAAGFDGVYLDRADVHSHWRREQPSAKADMIDFLIEIASYARQKNPGFLVMLQNAEDLLGSERLRRALDGVAKEDLLFGHDGDGRENAAAEVQSSLRYLRQARGDGMPVLVVEYIRDAAAIETARQRMSTEGFIAHFAPRSPAGIAQSH
jgi:cysteinyl-tRNA synthetase, unknown class